MKKIIIVLWALLLVLQASPSEMQYGYFIYVIKATDKETVMKCKTTYYKQAKLKELAIAKGSFTVPTSSNIEIANTVFMVDLDPPNGLQGRITLPTKELITFSSDLYNVASDKIYEIRCDSYNSKKVYAAYVMEVNVND